MLNVLTIAPYNFLPPNLGGQKNIALFYKFFSPLVNLTCVTTKKNETEGVSGYEILKILSNSRLRYINLFYFFKFRKIIRQKKITHLILEHPYYGWLGILLKWTCNIKLVVRSQNIESIRFKSIGKWWWGILWHYERATHKRAHINFFIQEDDRKYGIEKFGLDPEKCFIITYGFELTGKPSPGDRQEAKNFICNSYGINKDSLILLFNGSLGYKPNLDAVEVILKKINPLLCARENFNYRMIICGNKLPAKYKNLEDYKEKNIIYTGFVDDITVFYKGADIFINPVIDGGGIKTKVVEALGYDLSVISTASGAIGISPSITGNKMKIFADTDWENFAEQVFQLNTDANIPDEYFDNFYWGNIAAKACSWLNT